MFKNVFSFSGRIRRTEYWLTAPLIWLIMILITFFLLALPFLLLIVWIIPLWISFAACVKRSHDLGNSGFLIILPIYNPFFLAFGGSQPFKNQYGPNPKGINLQNNENPNIVINNIVQNPHNNFKPQSTQQFNENRDASNTTKNQHENQHVQNKEDIYKQLSLIHDLKEKGILTEEAYNLEKQSILKNLQSPTATQHSNIPPKTEPIIEKKNPEEIKPITTRNPTIQTNQTTFTRRHNRTYQNNNNNNNNQNSNKLLIIIIVILTVLILAVVGYYYYQNIENSRITPINKNVNNTSIEKDESLNNYENTETLFRHAQSIGSNVNVRKDHSISSDVVFQLDLYESFEVSKRYQPSNSNSNEAILNQDFTIYSDDGNSYNLNKGKAIKILNESGSTYTISFSLNNNQTIQAEIKNSYITKVSNETWYQITNSNGKTGWVLSKFIKPSE